VKTWRQHSAWRGRPKQIAQRILDNPLKVSRRIDGKLTLS
jgi:hypothetical protein